MTDNNNEEENEIIIKLVIIGDSMVGKTNFLYRFVDGVFNAVHTSTVGFDFKPKIHYMKNLNKKIKFYVWDTAGQEKYMAINKSLFQRVQGIILMYDISDESSFNNLPKWINLIKEYANNLPFILVGNKSDLQDIRKIPFEKGENFAKQNDIKFLETSSKSGENVDKCFEIIGEIVMNNLNNTKNENNNNYVISKTNSKKTKKKCC